MVFLSGCGTLAPLVPKESSNYPVSFYLMVNQKSPTYSKGIVPAGSLVLSCGEYLTLRREPTMAYTDGAKSLRASLARLFALQLPKDSLYVNNISAQNALRLAGVDVKDNIATVRLEGKLNTTGNSCYDGAMKIMIEQTVNQFGLQVNIVLNDSVQEWECLFSTEQSCK